MHKYIFCNIRRDAASAYVLHSINHTEAFGSIQPKGLIRPLDLSCIHSIRGVRTGEVNVEVQILMLSIIAKCGVFTHVRELARALKRQGIDPVLGLIHSENTIGMFKLKPEDWAVMEASMSGIRYFLYSSEEDLLIKTQGTQFALIHAHSPIVLSGAVKVSMEQNIPFVMTLHGVINWSALHCSAMEHANRIIAIGPEVAKSAGADYQNKVEIIYNGIDTEHYVPGKLRNYKGPLRILWMGRTSGAASQGASCLARSLRLLRRIGVPTQAILVGHALGADTREMKIAGWIHDPLPYLQWSHMVFGRGRTLREAMACGNAGFLIGQGYGGLVQGHWFEQGRQPQLSGSLKHGAQKLSSAVLARELYYYHIHRDALECAGRTARSIAQENFTAAQMAEKTCAVYKTVTRGSIFDNRGTVDPI